ncbi:hypothetical protein RUM43_012260 [Polyplax serrata]|uniref:Uncharacterized protein n=1 Tax=Polyplax serrata TaxID=468196 RepID=A0AAN8P3F1_POLSC
MSSRNGKGAWKQLSETKNHVEENTALIKDNDVTGEVEREEEIKIREMSATSRKMYFSLKNIIEESSAKDMFG